MDSYDSIQLTPDPGDTKANADDLGALSSTAVIRGGYVGVLDEEDYYRLVFEEPGTLSLDVTEVQGDVYG